MFNIPNFRARSDASEIIDDFSMSGEPVVQTFKTIELVNTLLGGNQVFRSGIKKIYGKIKGSKIKDIKTPLKINDLGCGSGDGLRSIALWGRKNKIDLQLTGVDANPFIVNYAREKAKNYPEIRWLHQDIFSTDCDLRGFDIITFNLCLHHFSESEQLELIQKCKTAKVKAILVNDLHRHWLAYYLFALFCFLTGANKVAKEDGLLSILKGFKKKELEFLAQKAGIETSLIQWKWIFRYEWILIL